MICDRSPQLNKQHVTISLVRSRDHTQNMGPPIASACDTARELANLAKINCFPPSFCSKSLKILLNKVLSSNTSGPFPLWESFSVPSY